jgi:hypothetical protein
MYTADLFGHSFSITFFSSFLTRFSPHAIDTHAQKCHFWTCSQLIHHSARNRKKRIMWRILQRQVTIPQHVIYSKRHNLKKRQQISRTEKREREEESLRRK